MPRRFILLTAALVAPAVLFHFAGTYGAAVGIGLATVLADLALRRPPRMPAAPAEARDLVWFVFDPDRGFARAYLCVDRAAAAARAERAQVVPIELDSEVSP